MMICHTQFQKSNTFQVNHFPSALRNRQKEGIENPPRNLKMDYIRMNNDHNCYRIFRVQSVIDVVKISIENSYWERVNKHLIMHVN